MAISTKLEMRQSQSLVMTPQLMQAIKLLQLSNLDLLAYVDAELERNPLLETVEPDGGGDAAGEKSDDFDPQAERDGADQPDAGDWMQSQLETGSEAIASRMDTDLGNVFPDEPGVPASPDPALLKAGDSYKNTGSSAAGEDYNLEAFVSEEETLFHSLEDQMNLAFAEPADKLIAGHLINSLDENGYLYSGLEEAADQLGVTRDRVEEVLMVLQTFEPAGVFARSLQECLKLQLVDKNRFDPAMEALVENIELLAKRDLSTLRRLCGVDDEDLADMIDEIKALDPKPGSVFGGTLVQPLVADVFVRKANDGTWSVELNSDTLPKVLVNQTYFATITKNAKNESEKEYLIDCMQTANWLVKSLDQRARTILKVSTEIVRQQDGFLTYGIEHLRPMNLKTIAEAVEMHESTISRVTSNKYMATPRGIYELKYFFSSAISATEGADAHSAESVRYRIKQMIDAEDPSAILSDDTIVKVLKDDGIDIARRTVAKYRESMKIGSSVQRRREKKALR
ncbi:RNA polymerase RpoN-/SigL-like sigma 54 subunit [Roseibium hamelinense]|uniref:RNA polymerase sigma-54 factor n=1 Tax=Roseibium hamelinense TaxID=150831 RepID=A0A562T205_9HYPH|nr:RNA polymerase factor sigma-54 [Roseibium hamelinense]MTI43821.1 RNA polymerase sigma-54 factor [Roseibium hamelinense]TWI87094.1 RNA polymerase RpoN-/SigL-like sigma 54 subunit [Roseibium hamelinense]